MYIYKHKYIYMYIDKHVVGAGCRVASTRGPRRAGSRRRSSQSRWCIAPESSALCLRFANPNLDTRNRTPESAPESRNLKPEAQSPKLETRNRNLKYYQRAPRAP